MALLESSVQPLKVRHDAERAALEERNARAAEVAGTGRSARAGSRAAKAMLTAGVSEMETRQRRELRRQRTDELRGGLAALAGAYRDRLAQAPEDPRRLSAALRAVDRIDRVGRDLQYNPGDLLQLQALLTRLGRDAWPDHRVTGSGRRALAPDHHARDLDQPGRVDQPCSVDSPCSAVGHRCSAPPHGPLVYRLGWRR